MGAAHSIGDLDLEISQLGGGREGLFCCGDRRGSGGRFWCGFCVV